MQKPVLIFDFDGTIADTFNYLIKIANMLSNEFGFFKILPEHVDYLKSKSVMQIIKHLRVPIMKVPFILNRAKQELNKDIESVMPFENLKEILEELKNRGFEIGILSTNSQENIKAFLTKHDLDIFNFISASSRIWGKNKNLKRLIEKENFDLEQVIYVGDEIRDIIAAQKANIKVAAVAWGFNSYDALHKHHPDYIINTPKDLLKLSMLKNLRIAY